MKIGVSMPLSLLCGEGDTAPRRALLERGGTAGWLMCLRDAGVTHIELRSVDSGTPEEKVARAARAVHAAGLVITVHGKLEEEPAEAFWSRLEPALVLQRDLTVTVHSAADREATLRLLARLTDYAREYWPDACLALENNRSKPEESMTLVGCGGVLETVKASARPQVGICWDMGHSYWDSVTYPDRVGVLPSAEFLRCAIHTHMHTVHGGTTHFPLDAGELPLTDFVRVLADAGYRGVWNLEPEPERWDPSWDVGDHILRSVAILREAVACREG